MRYLVSVFFIIVCASGLSAQVTFRLTGLPSRYTPELDTLFLAGDFNGWNPRNPAFRFQKNPQGIPELTVQSLQTNLLYKVTRGSWATVEVAASGQDIPNRSSANTAGSQISLSVADWSDTKGNHTAGPRVSVLTSQLWLPSLKKYRRIWVYLPAAYALEPNRRFPVMYFHDGQNVMDAATSFSGEWRVDEALIQLENQPAWEPVIAVGIDHGGQDRITELTPFRHPNYGGGNAENYASAVVEVVKPLIDSLYRTKKEAPFTAIGGSSLGGVASLFMAYQYPDVFSKALIFSPSLWFSDSLRQFCLAQPQPTASRLFWACGTNEGDPDMVPDMNQCYNDLILVGMPAGQMFKKVVSGGTHSESFWSSQVQEGMQWLFSGTTVSNEKLLISPDFRLQSHEGILEIQVPESEQPFDFSLYDILGRHCYSGRIFAGANRFVTGLRGLYLMETKGRPGKKKIML